MIRIELITGNAVVTPGVTVADVIGAIREDIPVLTWRDPDDGKPMAVVTRHIVFVEER